MNLRPFALTLALLAPALLVGGVMAWLGRPAEAVVAEGAAVIDRKLALFKTFDVVIVGNSKARTDIEPDALAAALGLARGRVVAIDVAASTAPTWYAVLENRVYGGGYQPKLVIVYGPLGMALDTEAHGAVQRMRLEEQLGPVEPVIGPKVLGRSAGESWIDRAGQRRTELHGAALETIRGLAVGLAFPEGTTGSLVERGNQRAAPALDRMFGAEADLLQGTRARVIPVAEAEGPLMVAQSNDAAASLLPDFVALAAAHDSRVVVVRAPVAASERASDKVDPAVVRGVVDLLNTQGAGWVDLSGLPLPGDAFRDGLHLNKKGRDVLTARLATAIQESGALGGGPIKEARAPITPTSVARVGAGPDIAPVTFKRTPTPCGYIASTPQFAALGDGALAAAGLGPVSPVVVTQDGTPLQPHAARATFADACGGGYAHFGREIRLAPNDTADAPHTFAVGLAETLTVRTGQGDEAMWVYPGTTVQWTFDAPPEGAPGEEAGRLAVEARVRVIGAGEAFLRAGGAEARLGRPADLPADMASGAPVTAAARVTPSGGAGPWTLEITSPPGGPWLVVEGVALGDGEARTWLWGEAPAPARLLEGGVRYAGDPPPVPFGAGLESGDKGTRRLAVPGLDALDDPSTAARLGVRDCSPLRLHADGQRLTAPHTSPADVAAKGGGRYAHEGGYLLVGPVNPLAPEAVGHTWTAALDPARTCEAGRWLYPGDVMTVTAAVESMKRLRHGATRLVLEGAAFASPGHAGPVTVSLKVKGAVVVDETVPAARWGAGRVEWTLTPPLPPRVNPVVVELRSAADSAWVLVGNVMLAEDLPDATLPAGPLPDATLPAGTPPAGNGGSP